jgi:hypothetical protein
VSLGCPCIGSFESSLPTEAAIAYLHVLATNAARIMRWMPAQSSRMTTAKFPDSYQGLFEHQHWLAVRCTRCQCWGKVNLARLVLLGHGRCHWRGAVFRCVRCGEASTTVQVGPSDAARSPQIRSQ